MARNATTNPVNMASRDLPKRMPGAVRGRQLIYKCSGHGVDSRCDAGIRDHRGSGGGEVHRPTNSGGGGGGSGHGGVAEPIRCAVLDKAAQITPISPT